MSRIAFASLIGLALFATTPMVLHSADPPSGKEKPTPEGTAHAAHAGSGNSNPLSVDPDLAIFTAIVFFVLLTVLWIFAWKPIIAGLDRREQSIADQIAEASRNAEQARMTLQQYEAKLATAANEVRQLMVEARRDADKAKEMILAEARTAAQRERDRAVEDIRLAKEVAVQELAQRSVDTAVVLAGRMIRKEIDSKAHVQLIQEALEQFPSQN